jgi:hypothetical protein
MFVEIIVDSTLVEVYSRAHPPFWHKEFVMDSQRPVAILRVMELEDRSLPNSLLDLLGLSLLGPVPLMLFPAPSLPSAVHAQVPEGTALAYQLHSPSNDFSAVTANNLLRLPSPGPAQTPVAAPTNNMSARTSGTAVATLDAPFAVDLFGLDFLSLSGMTSSSLGHDSMGGASSPPVNAGGAAAGGTVGNGVALGSGGQGAFAAQPNVSPVHSNANLQGSAGAQGPGGNGGGGLKPIPLTGGITLNMSNAFVPVNTDDYNGSPVTNGIPQQRDFSVAPLPVADPNLISGTVQGWGSVNTLPGTWSISVSSTDAGSAALWIDQKKTAPFTSANCPGTFYVEGVHESPVVNDLTIKATYTFTNGGAKVTSNLPFTVTPVINAFSVTPAAAPNIFFTNQGPPANGLNGLESGAPGVAPGATFSANVTRSNHRQCQFLTEHTWSSKRL